MWRRNVCILSLAVVAGCLDVVSVPTGGTPTRPLPSAQAKGEHLWVFHIAGGPYADHIQLVSIGDHADAAGRRVFRPLSSRAWDGSIVNDFTDLQATAVDTGGLSWSLHGTESGLTFGLRYALTADTAIGAFSLADGTSYPVFGVRFDSATVNLVVPTRPVTVSDTLPTVLIRLDDASANDRDFLQRLQLRGLTAEVAVPSRFVGQPDRLTWEDLQYWRAQGMGVVSHSRNHLSTDAAAQDFVGETVGGLVEMAANGFPTNIFVQPGTWRDSIYFDSPAKLHTWRGALLRTFTTVSECYAYHIWVPALADSFSLGLSHGTISDGNSDVWIRAAWKVAVRRNYTTVFLVHTFRLARPDQLDWFLDMVAAAKAQGSVRVVSTSAELFGAPAPTAPDVPDSSATKLDQ